MKIQKAIELSSKSGLVHVGKVKEAHGIRGDFYVLLFADSRPEWLSELSVLKFFAPSQQQKPSESNEQGLELQVKNLRAHKKGFVVQTQEIEDRNQAESLKGYEFYIPQELLVSAKGEAPYLAELLPLKVLVEGQEGEGVIQGFASNGAQDILQIQWSSGQVIEVPFVEAFVRKMDFAEKRLVLDLPFGFFEETE